MLAKLLALAVLVLATSSPALAAAGGCHSVSGTFVNTRVPCVVPAILCVSSQLAGDFSGSSTSLVTFIDPATGFFRTTTTNVLDNGAVFTGTIEGTAVNGIGHSVEMLTGGTRQFAHATGSIVTDSINGVGTYTGEYCLGNGGHKQ